MTYGEYFKRQDPQFGKTTEREFNDLLLDGRYYPYATDSDNGYWAYTILGDYENNRLFVKMKNSRQEIFGRINSNLLFPKMIDRFIAMDYSDGTLIEMLTDFLIAKTEKNESDEQIFENWDKLNPIKK